MFLLKSSIADIRLGSGYAYDSRLIFIVKIKCIRLFCICNFEMNFIYFASMFISFPPASFKPLVLLFSPHEEYGGLMKNPESLNKK